MKGASVKTVASQLSSGSISPSNLPIEYVVRDNTMIALNNRSLAALSLAGTKPTVLVNVTGNPVSEAKVTNRLSEMGGSPSESILTKKSWRNSIYTEMR